jgi:proline dehydrogenase
VTRVRVELLVTPECPHADPTEARIRAVGADLGIDVTVARVVIDDLDEAASFGFPGSPTLRVRGRDAVPVRLGQEASLGCRLYRDEEGRPVGVVPDPAIRDALAAVLVERERPGPLGRARELPGRALRHVLSWASGQPRLEGLVRDLPPGRALVDRFVAGEDLEAALVTLAGLREAGLRTTVDVLGEAVTDPGTARAAAERYASVIEALTDRGMDGQVSLKLSGLGLGLDVALASEGLARVASRAAELGAFVRVDMEDSSRTQATLDLVRRAHAEHGNVGVAVQAYLRRSRDDIEHLNAEGISVRLCKGAYDEPARIAFTSRAQVDESFERLAQRLLAEGTQPALATHDERLIEAALGYAERHAIPASHFEVELLHGVRRDLQDQLARDGYAVRVYVPFGTQWYPYFMRRLAERPANVAFLLRALLRPEG